MNYKHRYILAMPVSKEGMVATFGVWVDVDAVTEILCDPVHITYKDGTKVTFARFLIGSGQDYCSTFTSGEELIRAMNDLSVMRIESSEFNLKLHAYHASSSPVERTTVN